MFHSSKLFLKNLFFLLVTLFFTQQLWAGTWDGPVDGPVGQTSKNIVYIANDLQNGGIAGVYRGVLSAAKELGWKVTVADSEGVSENVRKELYKAISSHANAIVVGGFQAEDYPDAVELAKQSKIVLVGWHAGGNAGPTKDLFTNVSTDPLEVAKTAADYVIKNGKGNIGVVFFNDSRFAVANAKTNKMKEVIEQCKRCQVLTVEDVNLSKTMEEVPVITTRLRAKFGTAWTHTLAINDLYFDNINFSLARAGRKDIMNISAGDGSAKAMRRIHLGLSQQVATVAEPLNAQGWQIVDELNRAFAGQKPSGYISKPLLVTTELLKRTGVDGAESSMGDYEGAYLKIWGVKKN